MDVRIREFINAWYTSNEKEVPKDISEDLVPILEALIKTPEPLAEDISPEVFTTELSADGLMLFKMSKRWEKAFPAFSHMITVLSYILKKGKIDMFNALFMVTGAMSKDIVEEIKEENMEEINNFLDTLDIDPKNFMSDEK